MQAHIPDNVPATDGADTSAAEVPEPQAEATNRVHILNSRLGCGLVFLLVGGL